MQQEKPMEYTHITTEKITLLSEELDYEFGEGTGSEIQEKIRNNEELYCDGGILYVIVMFLYNNRIRYTIRAYDEETREIKIQIDESDLTFSGWNPGSVLVY